MHSQPSISKLQPQPSEQKRFYDKTRSLKNINLPIRIQDNMLYQQSVIKQHFNPNNKCFACQKQNRYSVQSQFIKAYQKLSIDQQINYYCLTADFLILSDNYLNQEIMLHINEMNSHFEFQVIKVGAEVEVGAIFRTWERCQLRLEIESNLLVITSKSHKNEKKYNLSSYLIHQVKFKQIIEFIPYQPDISSVRIKIQNRDVFENIYKNIKLVLNKAICQYFFLIIEDYRKFKIVSIEEQICSRRSLKSPDLSYISTIKKHQQTSPGPSQFIESPFMLKLYSGNGAQVIEQNQVDEQLQQSLERTQKLEISQQEIIKTLNMMDESYDSIKQQITNGIINSYLDEIQNMEDLRNYNKVMQYRNCYFFQHRLQSKLFKYVFQLSSSIDRVSTCLLDIDKLSKWNKCVNQSDIIARLSSQNTVIIHEEHFPTSKFSRGRDFVFSRHVFKTNSCYYFVDTPMQHFKCPQSLMLIRTIFEYSIWRIERKDNGTRVIFQIKFERDPPSMTHLKRYFEGYYGIEEYLLTQSTNFIQVYVSLNWEIKLQLKKQTENSDKQPSSDIFYTVENLAQQSQFHSVLNQQQQQQHQNWN